MTPQNHATNIVNYYCQSSIKHALVQRGVVPLVGTIQGDHPVAGKIALFLDNWTRVTHDDWVLATVQGYKLELLDNPAQAFRPREITLSLEEQISSTRSYKKCS